MIGYLKGEVLEIFNNNIILLVGGVGYKVFPTTPSLETLKKGQIIAFYIASIIKEDVFDLYGFETIDEKNLFDMIIAISGIGPRTGLSILSKGKIDDIKTAVIKSDTHFFEGVPRLGKKNAQKLIIELKPKIGDLSTFDLNENKDRNDLIEALIGFGYQKAEILPYLSEIDKNGESIEQKISYALKHMGKKI